MIASERGLEYARQIHMGWKKLTWLGALGLMALAAGGQTNEALAGVMRAERMRAECVEGRRMICGRLMRRVESGWVVESGYTNLLRAPLTKSWLVPGSATASKPANLVESREPDAVCIGTVYLADLPRGRGLKPRLYDYVILRGYPAGTYTYATVGGNHKTVRRFSTNLEKAVKLNLAAQDAESGVKGK